MRGRRRLHDDLRPPTDLRADRRRAERALVAGVVIFLLVVGGLLIGLIYGWSALLTGLLCLVPGAALLIVLWLLLRWLEWLSERGE